MGGLPVGLLGAPLAAEARTDGKIYRVVDVLYPGADNDVFRGERGRVRVRRLLNRRDLPLPKRRRDTCAQLGLNISSFGEDEAGEIYVVDLGGTVQRIARATPCTISLALASRSVPARGTGLGTVSVDAPAGCGWTASSNAPWITITSRASGSGNGLVSFSVASNEDSAQPRSGTITIADGTLTVTQSVAPGAGTSA